eukprot:Rmarinus@m.22086
MIKAVIVVNHHGKPRLTKFYEPVSHSQEQRIVRELYNLVSKRSENVCNILDSTPIWPETKVLYRRYATLCFIVCAMPSESELGVLDLMQVFVETLDSCFKSVCELDFIFHSDKVHYVLEEIICGGMVLETNKMEIMGALEAMEKLSSKS